MRTKLLKRPRKVCRLHFFHGSSFNETVDMEVICKFIRANSLISVMALPEAFRNPKLEFIVLSAENEHRAQRKTGVPCVNQSLMGTILHTDMTLMTLSKLRDEKPGKYENADGYKCGARRPCTAQT